MDTPIHPRPPVHSRVLGPRHARLLVKAPLRARLGGNLAAAAEQGPDGERARLVAGVVLLCPCKPPPHLNTDRRAQLTT